MAEIGRPTMYTQDLADKICAELSEGKSLRTVCNNEEMPCKATVFCWLRTNKSFLDQYTRAKEESSDAMIEEMLDIADDGSNDFMTIVKGNTSYEVENKEVTNRSRLRVDTRKWIASKLKPKKYGDKLDLSTLGKELPAPILGYVQSNNSHTQDNADGQTNSSGAGGNVSQ